MILKIASLIGSGTSEALVPYPAINVTSKFQDVKVSFRLTPCGLIIPLGSKSKYLTVSPIT